MSVLFQWRSLAASANLLATSTSLAIRAILETIRLVALSLSALLVLSGCGERRKFSLEGTWVRGGISGDHFGTYVLRIHEDSSGAVTGTACRMSSGFFIFGDPPVRGQYPYVIFENGTSRYTGGIVSPDEIIGRQVGATFSQEWIFQRVEASAWDICLSAPRPPGAPRS